MNPEVAAKVDAVCDAFEGEWRAGREPEIAAAVLGADAELRNIIAQQLMLVDMEYRRAKYGAVLSVDEYAAMIGVDLRDPADDADTLDGVGEELNTPELRARGYRSGLDSDSRPEDRSGYGSGPSETGPMISGYDILSELGRGGMGIVYKARQIRAGRLVALKTIHVPHLASGEQVQRFQAEAQAAARLTHQGIVPVFEVGESNGVHFFSMGLIDGPNLEMRAREQVLSSRAGAEICRDLADALEYAHENGVIHRDVKPLNVLMGPDGKPRLTDFGLARLRDQEQGLTSTGQILGTATYMPPEQAMGSASVGPATDIYSLGATLYRCITGRPPFQAATTMEVLRQVANDEPVSPRRLNQEIDVDIETICLKCLEKDPSRRFQTAGELSAELSRYLRGEPIRSRSIGSMERAWRWCRRRPATAASLAMFAVIILIMSTGVPYVLLHKSLLQEAALKDAQDARLIEQSEAARKLEQASRKQAEQLAAANAARAATQEYYVSIMKVRELRMQPNPKAGWTWEALDLLQKAATANADGKDPVVLRSLIADTLMSPDLREIGRIEGVPNTHALAVSHDGKLLAAGDWSGNPSRIRIYRIQTSQNVPGAEQVQFELIRECCVGTTMDFLQEQLMEWGILSGKIQREGMWALDFSPDDSKIAVGTRNGNLMIWQIDCDPAKILFDKRFPETGTDRLNYSGDGRQIILNYHEPAALRVFRVDDQSDRVELLADSTDFDLLSDGRILTAGDSLMSRLSLDSTESPVEFRQPGLLSSVCTDRRLSLAAAGTSPVHLLDALTGESTLVLQDSDRVPERPSRLIFSADTMMTVAAAPPQDLILWDSISGKQAIDISFPGNETPVVCDGREHDRIYVYSTVNTFAYQLRCPQALKAVVTPVTSLANAAPPVTALVPGAQSITSFALSPDQQHVAIIEAGSLANLTTIPDGYRARLRKLEAGTGREVQHWTCLLASTGEDCNTLTQGDSVSFLEDGRKIAFTTPAAGNIAVASDAGFEFLSGVGRDVQQAAPEVTALDTVTWTGGEVGRISKTAGFRPAIALKLSRGLKQSRERLVLRLICGDTTREYDLADRHLDASGWYLICLDQFADSLGSGTWRIEAKLVDSDLHFTPDPADAATDDQSAIQAGNLFLLPWKRLSRGKTPPVYPFRLGPLIQRHDGGLAAIVESWTLYQWQPGELTANQVLWRDSENSEEDIRSLSPVVEGCFAGTDSGVAAVVAPDGSTLGLDQERTPDGSYDSRDGVTATATADAGKLAATGTLQGQIKLYRPRPAMTAPESVTDAHSRELVALSLAEDGRILASASADGELKFWKVQNDRLELWFELTSINTPVVNLQFSHDGQYLYVLRQGERGVRRIDVKRMQDLFSFVQLH